MHIKRLYIGDFGILRNQIMENISPGLVMVGGPNRAGKTTLMMLLNRLGYGLTKGGQLPPPTNKYQVEADVLIDGNGDVYNIRLDGLSIPLVSAMPSNVTKGIGIEDIYHVDAFTYKQLFTISLDQLTKVPLDVENKDKVKLQSILLGAGLSDIVQIPRLEQKFSKEAKAIGGITGNIGNKGFKPYVSIIKDGLLKKKKALGQVDKYREKLSELSRMEEEISRTINTLNIKKSRLELLELLKNNYNIYQAMMDTKDKLETHEGKDVLRGLPIGNIDKVKVYYEPYKKARDEWQRQYHIINERIASTKTNEIMDQLLKNRVAMERVYTRLSGLSERLNHVNRINEQLRQEKNNLLLRIKNINANWTESELDTVEGLNLDIMQESRLMDAAVHIRQSQEQIDGLLFKIEETVGERDRLLKHSVEIKASSVSGYMKGYLYASIGAGVLGIFMYYLIHQTVGLFTGVFGILGAALYSAFRAMSERDIRDKQRDIDDRIVELSERIKSHESRLTSLNETKNHWYKEIKIAAEAMRTDADYSPDRILESFKAMREIQSRLFQYKILIEESKRLDEYLKGEFNTLTSIVKPLEQYSNPDFKMVEDYEYTEVIGVFTKWYEILKDVILLDGLKNNLEELEGTMSELMGEHFNNKTPEDVEKFLIQGHSFKDYMTLKTDHETMNKNLARVVNTERVHKAISVISADVDDVSMEFLYRTLDIIVSSDEIEQTYHRAAEEIESMERKLDGLKEFRQTIRDHLKRLSQTFDLEGAQYAIDSSKAALMPVAHRYAVLKAAAYLSGKIRTGFMERMRDELLANAGQILSTITSGEYKSITPGIDLGRSDFSLALEDGHVQDGVDILSRGTREQVFLAVRLGRIQDIKPTLPVIMDDTFVNFDRQHLQSTLSVISQLSKTHQVFLMTCHPHMVNLINDSDIDCQYWHLDKGVLTHTDGKRLILGLEEVNSCN